MRIAAVLIAMVAAAAACSTPPRKSRTPAEVVLDAVKAAVEREVKATGKLPVASVDRTPAEDCCAAPERRCTPAQFANLAWIDPAKLPAQHYFQLTYDSDGTTATIHAIGNGDCDYTFTDTELTATLSGTTVTWTTVVNAAQD